MNCKHGLYPESCAYCNTKETLVSIVDKVETFVEKTKEKIATRICKIREYDKCEDCGEQIPLHEKRCSSCFAKFMDSKNAS